MISRDDGEGFTSTKVAKMTLYINQDVSMQNGVKIEIIDIIPFLHSSIILSVLVAQWAILGKDNQTGQVLEEIPE